MSVVTLGLGGASLASMGLVALFKLGRPYFSVRVNCWFCSQNSRVDFGKRNSWTCNSCGQYNGFTADGDYNRDIPEQWFNPEDKPGYEPTQFAVQDQAGNKTEEGNGLCRTCNLNQELKIHQLKNFIPSNQDKFDDEIREYQSHLERTYKLCRYCEAILHQKLGEQDCWLKPNLLAWKLELNRQSPLSSALRLDQRSEDRSLVRVTLFLSLVLFLGTCFSSWISSQIKPWEKSYGFNFGFRESVTSLLMIILTSYSVKPWVVVNYPTHQASVAAWISMFFYAVYEESFLNLLNANNMPTVSPYPRAVASLICFAIAANASRASKSKCHKKSSKKPIIRFESRVNEDLFEKEETLTQDLLSTTESSVASSIGTKATHTSPLRPPIRPSQLGAFLPNHEVHQGDDNRPVSFEDDPEVSMPPCDISSLHIDKNKPVSRPQSPAPFEVRQYDPVNTCGINFGTGGESVYSPSRPILRQPRFVYEKPRRVAQSSWVAGGYWQPSLGLNDALPDPLLANLSRASSQTSGFVSVSHENHLGSQPFSPVFSSLPNSRVNSVCGDRHSVLSEPTYTNSRGMNMHSLGDQLAFFDTTRKTIREQNETDSDSLNSSIGPLTQSAFLGVKPTAESSPIEKRPECSGAVPPKSSFLQTKIHFSVSLSSLLLVASLSLNVAIIWYMASN